MQGSCVEVARSFVEQKVYKKKKRNLKFRKKKKCALCRKVKNGSIGKRNFGNWSGKNASEIASDSDIVHQTSEVLKMFEVQKSLELKKIQTI